MTDLAQELAALRQAAQDRDPEQTQYLLKGLFLKLGFYGALAVAAEQVYGQIDTFERYHPEADWPRQLLSQVVTMGVSPGDLPVEWVNDFHTPGAANFLKAVFDVCLSVHLKYPLEARIGYLVSAVANAIMAGLVESWYSSRPDTWERVRQNRFDSATGQYTDPEATRIAYRFWTNEAVARCDREAWLAVADQVERHLNR